MPKTIDITPNWDGLRRWVRHVFRTDPDLARRIARDMGSEAPDFSDLEEKTGGMTLGQDMQNSRYYNADKYSQGEAQNLVWWIIVIGDKEIPRESELDVWARDKREAREVAKVALARDFEDRVTITEILMA